MILSLRDEYTKAQAQIKKLKDENAKLREEIKQQKIKGVNRETNKPSSKKAEWEDKAGKSDQPNDDQKKKLASREKLHAELQSIMEES